MDEEMVEIKIKMPLEWFDPEVPSAISRAVEEEFKKQIRKAVTEQYISKLKLPQIKLSEEQVKDKMLDILAKKALQDLNSFDDDDYE